MPLPPIPPRHHLLITGLQAVLTFTAVLATVASASKRGLAYNDGIDISGFPRTPVSWTYNWDNTTSSRVQYGEFVPMLWGTQACHTEQWARNAKHWLGSQPLLGFNEPNRRDQANMSPDEAVDAWHRYMEPFHKEMTQGNGPNLTSRGHYYGYN